MALKKNSQGVDPSGTPVENNKDKPFLFKTDFLIHKKLATKNLSISNADKIDNSSKEESDDLQKIITEAVNYFKAELLLSHPHSILIFYEYCIDSLVKIFATNVDFEKMMKSTNLQMISLMTTGFRHAMFDFANNHGKTSNPDREHFQETIPTLFNESEFSEIINSVVYLLKDFPNQVKKAYQWLIEDIEPAKNQMDAILGMMEILKDAGTKKFNPESKKVKNAAQKVIDECLHKNGDHKIYGIQGREQFGIFTPDKELLINISRILNYLDILSYGKYLKVPTNDPNDLKFQHCEF